MTPVIVSYFTIGTLYEPEAREMEASARDFGLFTDVRGVPNLGDWTSNCAQKAAFIRDRIGDYPGRPIVWLDADARVRRQPTLFDTLDCDFAAHWRHGVELLSGTLYFGATDNAKALAEAWCDHQQKCPGEWDQRVLSGVIERDVVKGLRIERLPPEYTAVWDDPKMGDEKTWVVSHHQASRCLRHTV